MSLMCPFCEAETLTPVTYTHVIKAGRRTVEVPGCQQMVCGGCGETVVPLTLYDHNHQRIEAALTRTPAAVSRGLLKRLRERYDLSQREASRLFGAGETAFAKWESGQSEMSDPAALLVQCALAVPGVMDHLAKLAGMQLPLPSGQQAAEPLLRENSRGHAPSGHTEPRAPTRRKVSAKQNDKGPRRALV